MVASIIYLFLQVVLQSETIQELMKTSQALASAQEETSELRKVADARKNENVASISLLFLPGSNNVGFWLIFFPCYDHVLFQNDIVNLNQNGDRF